jgi:Protein of unknown function (DUF4244)
MRRRRRTRSDAGMNTAEYAIGTVAACGFACLLLQVLTNWRLVLVQIFLKALDIRFGWPPIRIPL